MNKLKMFGNQNPFTFAAEWTYGCNLKCGHCAIPALGLHNKFKFMSMQTWIDFCNVVNAVGPQSRVEMAAMGEPTMHPEIYKFLETGRELMPDAQIHVTTNGINLLAGKVEYKRLLDSGANIIYTDMYGPPEKFETLAKDSGFPYWYYYPEQHIGRKYTAEEEKSHLSPWTYHGPHVKFIALQDHPANWPESRRRANLLGTWMNHIDEKAAAKFGMEKVTVAPMRRCNQPFIYCVVNWAGEYLMCCQDAAELSAGSIGNVRDGVEGFRRSWFGRVMQDHRRWLREKDRMASPYCSKCSITFSRSDFRHWDDNQVASYIEKDGSAKRYIPPIYRCNQEAIPVPPKKIRWGGVKSEIQDSLL